MYNVRLSVPIEVEAGGVGNLGTPYMLKYTLMAPPVSFLVM